MRSNKLQLKASVFQLDNMIQALLVNAFNKKFVNNIYQLFNEYQTPNDYDKEVRVYLIQKIAKLIIEENITEKEAILSNLDITGKYYIDGTDILNNLKDGDISESEMSILDKQISNQLKYSKIEQDADSLIEELTTFKTDNYASIDDQIKVIESKIEGINKNLKSANESIEDSKKGMDLSSDTFLTVLDDIIEEERNPSFKVLTGIQYMNNMLNGGFEKG